MPILTQYTDYRIPFKDLDGNSCEVAIGTSKSVDSGSWTGNVTTYLTPAANPFVTSMDNGDSPMMPIRTGTAKISYLSTSPMPVIEINNSHEWRVIFICAGTVRWLGWLKAEILTQPYSDRKEQVTLSAVSDLGSLKTWDISLYNGLGVDTFHSLFAESFNHMYADFDNYYVSGLSTSRKFWVPADLHTMDSSSPMSVFDLSISRANFIPENTSEDLGDGTYESFSPDSCYDCLEKLCTFLGYTLKEDGLDIMLVREGYGSYLKTPLYDFCTGTYTTSAAAAAAVNLTDLEWRGTNHTVDLIQGKRIVRIIGKLNQIGDVIPKVDDAKHSVNFVDIMGSGTTYNYVAKVFSCKDSRYLFPLYELKDSGGTYPTVGEFNSSMTKDNNLMQDGTTLNWKRLAGSVYLSHQSFIGDDVQVDDINFSLTDMIRVNQEQSNPNTGGYSGAISSIANMGFNPMFGLISSKSALYSDGCFELKFSVGYSPAESVVIYPSNVYAETDNYVEFMLKVGDKYFDGNTWDTITSTFRIDLEVSDGYTEWHTFRSNKTLDMLEYNGVTGYMIPIDQPLSGQVEFYIMPVAGQNLLARYSQGGDLVQTVLSCMTSYWKDFSLDYVSSNAELFEDETVSQHSYAKKNDGFTEDLDDVELNVISDNGDPDNYAQVSYGGAPLEYLASDATQVTDRPEEILLARYNEIFGASHKLLTLTLKEDSQVRVNSRIRIDGDLWPVLSRTSVNWRTREATYILSDVTGAGGETITVTGELSYHGSWFYRFTASEASEYGYTIQIKYYNGNAMAEGTSYSPMVRSVYMTAGTTTATIELGFSGETPRLMSCRIYQQEGTDRNVYVIAGLTTVQGEVHATFSNSTANSRVTVTLEEAAPDTAYIYCYSDSTRYDTTIAAGSRTATIATAGEEIVSVNGYVSNYLFYYTLTNS